MLPHTGYVYYCELVQKQPPDIRKKAARLVAAKCSLAARVDAHGGTNARGATVGIGLREDIERKIDKALEPPPAKAPKPLPAPDEVHRKKRAGKRYSHTAPWMAFVGVDPFACRLPDPPSRCSVTLSPRSRVRRQKEKYAASEAQKASNRMGFAELEEDVFQAEMGPSLGKATGNFRAPEVKKAQVRISKKMQVGWCRGGGATSASLSPVLSPANPVPPMRHASGSFRDKTLSRVVFPPFEGLPRLVSLR